MNINELLQPVTAEQPCGDNLEYDAQFQEMEQAMQGKAEQQFGETIIPAEPADWAKVEKLATKLLERSKDLRIMLPLAQAWTIRHGIIGYADAMTLIVEAVKRFWTGLYPTLEEFGESDPFYRVNALAGLGDRSELTSALRNSLLLRRLGDEISFREAIALLDGSKVDSVEFPGGKTRLIDELSQGDASEIVALHTLQQHLTTLRQVITEHLDHSAVPEMEQLEKQINLLASFSQEYPASTDQAPLPEVAVDSTQNAHRSTSSPAVMDWRTVELASRADVHLALDKAKAYFAHYEPSHPAPMMIERVQRLIELDFMDIVRDLAPDGVHQLQNIFGRRD